MSWSTASLRCEFVFRRADLNFADPARAPDQRGFGNNQQGIKGHWVSGCVRKPVADRNGGGTRRGYRPTRLRLLAVCQIRA